MKLRHVGNINVSIYFRRIIPGKKLAVLLRPTLNIALTRGWIKNNEKSTNFIATIGNLYFGRVLRKNKFR